MRREGRRREEKRSVEAAIYHPHPPSSAHRIVRTPLRIFNRKSNSRKNKTSASPTYHAFPPFLHIHNAYTTYHINPPPYL
jgi:hypothetical protein